jgi:hypothetical protein
MKHAEYLEFAAQLERIAAEIELPNFKECLLRQAEHFRRLRNERLGGQEKRTDTAPAPDDVL